MLLSSESAMFPLLLFLLMPYLAHCSCPAGYELVSEGQCRGFYGSSPGKDLPFNQATNTAIQKCQEVLAQPVIIHNDEEQEYWENINQQSKEAAYLVLGLVCNIKSMRWQWADGSKMYYKPKTYNSALNSACKADCTWYMHSDDANGIWYATYEDYYPTYPYYINCITQLQPVSPVEGCENFADDTDDDICYQVGATAASWQDAQLTCKKLGANLASIHNTNENSVVRRLAVSKGAVHGVFLGATVSGDHYGWTDGSEWDYTNFYPGFPKSELGDCIALDTSSTSGQWMNVDCSSPLSVACIRENITTPIKKNATCTYDTVKEGAIFTSPAFPFDASMPCDYYLEAAAGKKVQAEIAFLEANSCCDSLILYEGYFGGYVIANLTGEIQNVTYTASSNMMRVSWVPNGGVNVKGMAMTFRGV